MIIGVVMSSLLILSYTYIDVLDVSLVTSRGVDHDDGSSLLVLRKRLFKLQKKMPAFQQAKN